MRIGIDMIQSARVKRTGAANNSMNLVLLAEKQFGQV